MPNVLYLGTSPDLVETALALYNNGNPESEWVMHDANKMPFATRITKNSLRTWLQGDFPKYQASSSYDCVVADHSWADLVHIVKDIHPKASLIILKGPEDREIYPIDVLLPVADINTLPDSMNGLLEAKQ